MNLPMWEVRQFGGESACGARVVKTATAATREDEWIIADARLCRDDLQCQRWQRQRTGVAFLTLRRCDDPRAVNKINPTHGLNLVNALAGQQTQSDNGAEVSAQFGFFPDQPQFIIGENPRSRWLGMTAHAARERRRVSIVSDCKPIGDAAYVGQREIGHAAAVIVFDVIE